MRSDTVMVEVQKRQLTDGSYVWDVHVWDPAHWVCTDEKAAFDLQDAIVAAARKCAVNDTVSGLTEV